MSDKEEYDAEFQPGGHELLFEFPDEAKGILYIAYCKNHGRAITGWTSDLAQIINAEYYHRRSHPGHQIQVYHRVR